MGKESCQIPMLLYVFLQSSKLNTDLVAILESYLCDLHSRLLTEYSFRDTLAGSGPCCAPGALLLDPRVNILPSPDQRTNLRHSVTPGTVLAAPGLGNNINRNMTLVPRGGDTRPQNLRWASWDLRGS